MKQVRLFLSVAFVASLFVACNTHQTELDNAIKQKDSLELILQNKDAEIDSLFVTLSEIEENLATVNARYNAVQELRRANIEGQPTIKTQISDQIKDIELLMATNKQKIATLQARVNASGKEGSRLQELINRQEERIASQEAQIAQLLTELENNKVLIGQLNKNVSELTASNEQKDALLRQQTEEANRAYYVVGNYSALSEAGIVSKVGGFIGIGRRQVTNTEMALDRFTAIDRTKVTTIPVNMKHAVVVSKHSENSYELVMDENDPKLVSYLRILNPAKFWEQTRFLVISSK